METLCTLIELVQPIWTAILGAVVKFQTLIVGLVAFVGVNRTLKANARLAEKERLSARIDRELTVFRAVKAEFRSAKKFFQNMSTARAPEVGGNLAVPQYSRKITLTLTSEIASLAHPETDEIIECLLTLDEIDRSMGLVVGPPAKGYFTVMAGDFENVRTMYNSLVDRLDELLPKLDEKKLHSAKA